MGAVGGGGEEVEEVAVGMFGWKVGGFDGLGGEVGWGGFGLGSWECGRHAWLVMGGDEWHRTRRCCGLTMCGWGDERKWTGR